MSAIDRARATWGKVRVVGDPTCAGSGDELDVTVDAAARLAAALVVVQASVALGSARGAREALAIAAEAAEAAGAAAARADAALDARAGR